MVPGSGGNASCNPSVRWSVASCPGPVQRHIHRLTVRHSKTNNGGTFTRRNANDVMHRAKTWHDLVPVQHWGASNSRPLGRQLTTETLRRPSDNRNANALLTAGRAFRTLFPSQRDLMTHLNAVSKLSILIYLR